MATVYDAAYQKKYQDMLSNAKYSGNKAQEKIAYNKLNEYSIMAPKAVPNTPVIAPKPVTNTPAPVNNTPISNTPISTIVNNQLSQLPGANIWNPATGTNNPTPQVTAPMALPANTPVTNAAPVNNTPVNNTPVAQPQNDQLTQLLNTISQSYNNPTPAYTPTVDYNSQMNQLNQLYQSMQDAQLAAQQAARDKEMTGIKTQYGDVNNNYASLLGQLNQEQTNLTPVYAQQRNQNLSETLKNLQGINEAMAGMGQYYGGANQQAQSDEKVAKENSLNNINLSEAQAIADIQRRQTEGLNAKVNNISKLDQQIQALQSQGALEDSNLIKQLQAQKLQSTMDLQNQQQQLDMTMAQLNNSKKQNDLSNLLNIYNSQQQYSQNNKSNSLVERQLGAELSGTDPLTGKETIASKNSAENIAMQLAQLIGKYKDTPTLAAKELENNIGNTQFNQDMTTKQFQQDTTNNQFNQNLQMADRTGTMQINTNAIPADSWMRQVQDYASEIQKRDPNDPVVPYLKALRNEKITSDPTLNAQYGNTLETPSMQTLAGKTFDQQTEQSKLQMASLTLDNAMKEIKLKNLPRSEELAVMLAQEQVRNGQLQNAAQTITNSNLDAQLKANIQNVFANINQSNASANASLINAETNRQSATNSQRMDLLKYNAQIEENKLIQDENKKQQEAKQISQQTATQTKSDTQAFNDFSKYITQLYMMDDGFGNKTMSPENKVKAKEYIKNLNVQGLTSDATTYKLLAAYGIPTGR